MGTFRSNPPWITHTKRLREQEPDATGAAKQKAQKLGVDLSQVEGTGSEGRITVKDVTGAANQG